MLPIRHALIAALAFAAATPVWADNHSGSYLAARAAIMANDFREAANHIARVLVRDPRNPVLLESGLTAYVGLGDLDRAAPVARRLTEIGAQSQLASLVIFGDAVRRGNWDMVLSDLDQGRSVGPLFDGLLRAWAELGAGRMSEALAGFDDVVSNQGVEAFGLYHKALALASVGDYEGAAEIFSGESGTTIRLTQRGTIAYVQILSQLERNADAIELIRATTENEPEPVIAALLADLEAGKTLPFTAVRTASDGVAEIYYSIASALRGEAQDSYTLLYARMALMLRPDLDAAALLAAQILEDLEQYDLAIGVYDSIAADSPVYHSAVIGRSEALRRAGRTEEAIAVLEALAESHGDIPIVHITLGDMLRGLERYDEAIGPYSTALELLGDPGERYWIVYFARAIAYERTGQWDKAEPDFRKALELRPDQPQVLNYLGYSFLEMKTNLDEALELIERAVALRPDSGYIVDSLGWGLYRLGRYEEAVEHMERAVELLPVDPIVNDHLGDVYWAVGRRREAEFQWHRALSFITEDTDLADVDPDRIRRKLEVGLDAVLAEEGAPPLTMANDGG